MSLPRYEGYKHSNIEWLDDVPGHWKEAPIGSVTLLIQTGPFGSQLHADDYVADGVPVINPSHIENGRLVADPNCAVAEHTCERLGQYRINLNDIILARRGEMGRCAVAALDHVGWLCGTGSLIVRVSGLVFPPFAAAYLGTARVRELLRLSSVGSTMDNLNERILSRVRLPLPPVAEQVIIAHFLERETGNIDALIGEQRRLIELLNEKRQAVVSQAVTSGLDPNAPMKSSGVEWIGEVPNHWEVVPLSKFTFDKCDGPFGSGLKSEHYTDEGVRVIRLQNIRREEFDASDAAYIDVSYYQASLLGHDVQTGDVLVAGLGDDRNTVGRACVAPIGIEPAMVKADCFRFRLDTQRALPEFVAIALSAGSSHDAGLLSSGSTRSRIPLSTMATRKIPLPQIDEQRTIVDWLAHQRDKFDELTMHANAAIVQGLLFSLGEVSARTFLLDEQNALPKEIDEAVFTIELLDRLLKCGDSPPRDAEHLKEFVVKGVRFTFFVAGILPLIGEVRSPCPNFIPR